MSFRLHSESNDDQLGAGVTSTATPSGGYTFWHAGREVSVEQVWAPDVREQVIDLLQFHHHWPAETRKDYQALWQWRYTALTERPPSAWVVRVGGVPGIVGHLAVLTRYYRLGARELVASVPADMVVHRDWRRLGLGTRLTAIPMQRIESGLSDFAVMFATPDAHSLARKAGYRDLGSFRERVELRKSGRYLRDRWRISGVLAPVVDAGLNIRSRFFQRARHLADWSQRFRVAPLTVDDFETIDRSHWQHPIDHVVGNDSVDFIRARFAEARLIPYTLFGIWDRRTDFLEGYVIAASAESRRPVITDCQANANALDVPTAIEVVAESGFETAAAWVVSTAGDTGLLRALARFGLISRPSDAHPLFRVFVYWDPRHPLATRFASPGCWTFLPGSAEF